MGTFVRQPQPRMGRGVMSSIRKPHIQTTAAFTAADNSTISSAGDIGSVRSETADVLCAQGDGQPSRLEGDSDSGGTSVVSSAAAADDDFDFSAVGSGAVTGSRKIRKSLSCFAPLPTITTTDAKPSELSEQVLQEECDASSDGSEEVKKYDESSCGNMDESREKSNSSNTLNNKVIPDEDASLKPQTFLLTVRNDLQCTVEAGASKIVQETNLDDCMSGSEYDFSIPQSSDSINPSMLPVPVFSQCPPDSTATESHQTVAGSTQLQHAESDSNSQTLPQADRLLLQHAGRIPDNVPHSSSNAAASLCIKMDPVGAVLTPPTTQPRQRAGPLSVSPPDVSVTSASVQSQQACSGVEEKRAVESLADESVAASTDVTCQRTSHKTRRSGGLYMKQLP